MAEAAAGPGLGPGPGPGPGPGGIDSLGRVMQVDPIKPTLTAPGTKRLKLKYDELDSIFAFKFNLCRHTSGARGPSAPMPSPTCC